MFIAMEWFLDGLGTEIVSIIIGLIVGGAGGYRIGIRKNVKQHQKAKDNAKQVQIGNIYEQTNSKSGE